MQAVALTPRLAAASTVHLTFRAKCGLAALCLVAGVAPLAARWLPDGPGRLVYGLLLAAVLFTAFLAAGRVAVLQPLRELAGAFFIFATVQVLNNAIPGYVSTTILHAPPTIGDPLASTLAGTVIIQLLETALAVVPILLLARAAGLDFGSMYLGRSGSGRWLVAAIGIFLVLYAFMATLPLRPGSPAQQLLPTNGPMTVGRFLALTPALLVMALSNGFQEELLFRGLFLRRYTAFFGPVGANVLQAVVFAVAHVGIGYTPVMALFLVAVVFPLGLLGGYLMRASNSVIVPSIVHAGLDIPIYLGFLSWVA